MGFSKNQLLDRLQELEIDYSKYEHPPVLTVEAQAKYVSSNEGALSKNLFLKDKKNRYYIVSAMADTKVDIKVLSKRLGLGKGALGQLLQVSLGCVTPFAVVNESARDVSLLLDKNFKNQTRCIFHPLSNDVSISLNTLGLDKYFQSIGRDPVYVDLEANPVIGKDQPPDLAVYVPSGSVVVPELPNKSSSTQPTKPSKPVDKGKSVVATSVESVYKNPEKFVEEMLDKTSALLLSEAKGESMEALAETQRERLTSELTHLAIMYKNTAYTEGFHAGKNIVQEILDKTLLLSEANGESMETLAETQRKLTSELTHLTIMYKNTAYTEATSVESVYKNPEIFVEEILDKTSALLLSEAKGESMEALAETQRKRLISELTHLAIMYKNSAYAEGFHAGKNCQPHRR